MYRRVQVRAENVQDSMLDKRKPGALQHGQAGLFDDLALELQSSQLLNW